MLLAGCASLAPTPASVLAQLQAAPDAYLTGTVVGLGPSLVLNREDFVWATAISPDSKRVAFVRLGAKSYHLTVWTLAASPTVVSEAVINPLEFDVEAIAWSADAKVIGAVSTTGSVQFFDAGSGKLLGGYLTEEPLVSIAFHPDGRSIALGSRRGLITLLEWPSLKFGSELRAHADEVRGLAFSPAGRLFSASWDRSVGRFDVSWVTAEAGTARLHFERKGGYLRLRGVVGSRASANFALDARMPFQVVLGTSFAAAAGIDASLATETVNLPTAYGTTQARLVRAQTVSFKGLNVVTDVAICDGCVPTDAQGVLGQPMLERYSLTIDEAQGEVVLQSKQARGESSALPQLTALQKLAFDASVNDVTVDASGRLLGLALSAEKGQRTREVYEREKKKQPPPASEWNCAAIVDAARGAVLQKQAGHRGVVASAAISPDGKTIASGGWDKTVRLSGVARAQTEFGWSVRRVRFSPDGRWLSIAAWTPQNPLGDRQSDPAAVLNEVRYALPSVVSAP